MKKSFKVLAMLLALTLTIGLGAGSAKAKSIYFAGKYQRYKGIYCILSMSQYSSPEGREVGTFSLKTNGTFYDKAAGMRVYPCDTKISGTLKKTSKRNVYQCKKGKSVVTLKVYKKKVVVKVNSRAKHDYYNFSGTYKLKKRYYS